MSTVDLAAVRARIAEHPWSSVGIAAAAGVALGLVGGRVREPAKPTLGTRLGDALLAALGALALRYVRDFAARKLAAIALDWWDEAQHRTADARVESDLAPFAEHVAPPRR